MDFLADEMDGLRIRRDRGADSFLRSDFHLLGRAVAAIIVVATTALRRPAVAAIARATATRTAVAVIATRRTILASGKGLGFALGGIAGGTGPRGSQGKAGQEAAQWIGIRIAHDAQSKE